jgi:hypothetical protein
MVKAKCILRSVAYHWWIWMGIALYLLSLAPAVTEHTIPRQAYWLAALVCVVIAFYKSWSEQYDRAELLQRELEEMYADIVLDWLKQHNPKIFSVSHLAEKMNYPEYKVQKGLKMLEKEFKGLVKDNGTAGWFYDPVVSMPLFCGLRRLPPPPKV